LFQGETRDGKGYWVSCYQSIDNPEKLAAYAKLAAPAILAGGGKFLVRGPAAKAYEQGLLQRTVIVEFDSLAAANAVHDGPASRSAAHSRRWREAGFPNRRRC
jgi:uncharacterized protein (DUF1330 family)